MFNFKEFIYNLIEERDPHKTIEWAERLANHPNTEKGIASAARDRVAFLRKKHNIPDPNAKSSDEPKSSESQAKRKAPDVKYQKWNYHKPTAHNPTHRDAYVERRPTGAYGSWHKEEGVKIHKTFDQAHEHLKSKGYTPK